MFIGNQSSVTCALGIVFPIFLNIGVTVVYTLLRQRVAVASVDLATAIVPQEVVKKSGKQDRIRIECFENDMFLCTGRRRAYQTGREAQMFVR